MNRPCMYVCVTSRIDGVVRCVINSALIKAGYVVDTYCFDRIRAS